MLSERRPPPVNSRISAFLESQRGLVSYYAAEGKSVAASWLKQSSGDSRPSSPMLAPRAAAAKGDGLRSNASPGQSVPTFPIDMDESSISKSKKPRPVDTSKPTRVVPIESRTSQRKSTAQDQFSDNESERLQRLEQRRKRRQARRYAIDMADSATDRGDETSEMDLSFKTNNKRQKLQSTDKMDNKKRKTKANPALLLMQNFSSQSLGKSRLTMRPSPTVGVFNKGKNSGKVKKEGQRAAKLVPDVVFSESKFLNKVASAHDGNEDTGVDSDSSDDHSAHSLTRRARQRKNREIKSGRHSSHKVIVDQVSRSGSSVHSSRSTREESPPWDIEESMPSSPGSAKSANDSPNSVYSTPGAVQKDIIVSTKRFAWASKMSNPGPHIPTAPDTDFISGIYLPKVISARPRTTSVYFAPIVTPGEPEVPITPPTDLDGSIHKHQQQQPVSCPVAAPDSANPPSTPSTPECLQVEHSRFLFTPGNALRCASRACLPLNDGLLTRTLSPSTRLEDSDIQYGVEFERKSGAQNYYTPESTEPVGWTNECTWSDPDNPVQDEYADSGTFLVGEADFHDVPTNLEYGDAPSKDRVEYSNSEVEYLYEDSEFVYEDTGYLLEDKEACTSHRGDYDLGYDDFEQVSPWNSNDYNSCMETIQEPREQEPRHLIECSTIDDPIMEHPVQDELKMEEDEWTEQPPRLYRVITEASLQDDLIKSMSGHWSTAHRLY